MDAILIPVLVVDLAVFVAFSIRSIYWGWAFQNAIWIKEAEQARRYGIPPDGMSGSLEFRHAVYSKEKCANPEVESLRMKARQSGKPCFISLILFPFIILGFILPRVMKAGNSFVALEVRSEGFDWTAIAVFFLVLAISTTVMIYITKQRKKRRSK